MATVEKRTWDRSETQQRIRHPLQAVGGYIRRYVVLEGAAVALLFLAACFWVWLAIDFGCFALFGLDGVKWLDRTFPADTAFFIRAFVFGLVIVGLLVLVAFKVLRRLFTEFSDSALALVLERRFPNQLGDRLITAVEMADPRLAEKYGHSQEMVDYTIRDAATRVASVPVTEVFNWGRLTKQWLLVALLTIGVYLLVFIGGGTILALTGESAADFFPRFNRTASIFTKRNALLMHRVYWPTRSYVEFVRFQAALTKEDGITEVMKVARDEKRPDIEVRAYQWVVYDTSAPDSIRPIKLSDLKGWLEDSAVELGLPENWPHWVMDTDDIDPSVPTGIIPESWNGKPAGYVRQEMAKPSMKQTLVSAGVEQKFENWLNWKTWSVDQIQTQLERKEHKLAKKSDDQDSKGKSAAADNKTVGQKMRAEHAEALAKIEALVGPGGKLEQLAEASSSNWNIRKLTIPAQVHVSYLGKQTRSYRTFAGQEEHRYYVSLSELKESVTLHLYAEDFYAMPKEIQLVPPPQFTQLMIHLEEPAYKYYRLQNNQALLEKARHKSDRPVSLTGPTSQFEVLIGTGVKLVATAERELKDGILIAPPPSDPPARKIKGSVMPAGSVKLHADKKTFSLEIPDVQQSYEFEFHFVDLDNVKGSRHIALRAVTDQAPEEVAKLTLNAPLRVPTITNEEGVTSANPTLKGFLITPDALIPFKGIMRDDIGLTKMEWTFDHEEIQFSLFRTETDVAKDERQELKKKLQNAFRNQVIATGFQGLPLDPAQGIAAPLYWQMVHDLIEKDIELASKEDKKRDIIKGTPVMMPNFALKLNDIDRSKSALLPGTFLEMIEKNQLVGDPPQQILLKEYDVFREDGFDVGKILGTTFKPKTGDVQKHYRLRVWMQAADNNLKSGPGVTQSKEAVTFLVVSPAELRALIMMQEDRIRGELEKIRDKLDKDVRVTLNDQLDKLKFKGGKDDPALDLTLVRLRVDADVRKHVEKATKVVNQSLVDYLKIKQEWEVNSMELQYKGYHKRIADSIIAPLEELNMLKSGEVAMALDAVSKAQAELELDEELHKDEMGKPKQVDQAIRDKHVDNLRKAQDKLDKLVVKLSDIIDAIGGGFGKAQAEAMLAALIEDQERQTGELKAMYKAEQERILKLLQDLEGK